MAANSNQTHHGITTRQQLINGYEELTRHVKQRRQGQEDEKSAQRVPDSPATPAMRQSAERSSTANARSRAADTRAEHETLKKPESTARRGHMRSASASSSEILTQSSSSVRLVKRHTVNPLNSDKQKIESSLKQPLADVHSMPQEVPKRGLRRRMKDQTREWLDRIPPITEKPEPGSAVHVAIPGVMATHILSRLTPNAARNIRSKLARLRSELEEQSVVAKRMNIRLRNLLVEELNALRDKEISAEIDRIPIGETLNAELDVLRGKLEKRGRFEQIDRYIDTEDPSIAREIDRLYVYHFFENAPEIPALPSSLERLIGVFPPSFIAGFDDIDCTLCLDHGKAEILAMPKEIARDPASQSQWKADALRTLAAFIGPSADGLLQRTVGEHLGPAFHLFVMDLLFSRRRADGHPESELRWYDGRAIRPLGDARISYRLCHMADGSIAIAYTSVMSPECRGGNHAQAELSGNPVQRVQVDPDARLQIDARIAVRSSRDVEITELRVRASGWNGG